MTTYRKIKQRKSKSVEAGGKKCVQLLLSCLYSWDCGTSADAWLKSWRTML